MGNIAGIDLGTTFSSLAMLDAIGKPEIIPNADGDRLTRPPSSSMKRIRK